MVTVQWPTQDMVDIHLSLFSVTQDILLSHSPYRTNVGFFVVLWLATHLNIIFNTFILIARIEQVPIFVGCYLLQLCILLCTCFLLLLLLNFHFYFLFYFTKDILHNIHLLFLLAHNQYLTVFQSVTNSAGIFSDISFLPTLNFSYGYFSTFHA